MTYKRKDLAVQVNIKTDRGYTMHAIGQLEDRIKRLEYYTVLNALELDTKTTSVRDATGMIERFKNGIFADPFNDHTIGNQTDPEYSIAVSSVRSIARPTFNQLFHEFQLSSAASTGVKAVGRLLMLDYVSEYFGGNKFATTYRNATESMYSFKGSVSIYPMYDNTGQSTQGAPQNITIDNATALQQLAQATGGLAQNIDTVTSAPQQVAQVNNGTSITTTFNQTTTTTIRDIAVSVNTIQQNAGNYVTDVSSLYYMLPRRLAFVARGLKPNTVMHFYFDKANVDQYVAPALVSAAYTNGAGDIDSTLAQSLALGKQDQLLIDNGAKGAVIKSNSTGTVFGVFYLPPNTFRAGDRVLIVTNVDDITATGAILTSAEGTYTSSPLSVNKSQLSFTILQPVFTPRTIEKSANTSWSVTDQIPQPSDGGGVGGDGGTGDGGTGTGDGGTGDGGVGGDGGDGGGCCFDPNALVLMSDNTWKKIKDIVAGEKVIDGFGNINTVLTLKTTTVGNRKMFKFKDHNFYSTDDHLFFTEAGWKTWRPDRLVDNNRENLVFLEGDNRTTPLNSNDKMVMVTSPSHIDLVDYDSLGAEEHTFDSDYVVYDLRLDGTNIYVVDGFVVHNCGDPVAQTFSIEDTARINVPGVFLTQIGMFFKSKSSSLGGTFIVVETTTGIPDATKVVGKQHITASEVLISSDSSSETVITLTEPILMASGITYAFFFVPDLANPDYELWISEVGGVDKLTGNAITQQPYNGIMYVSNNGKSWTAVQSQDLKFRLYRARFTSLTGTAVFRNETDDFLSVTNLLRANSSVSISVGDVVYTANTANTLQIQSNTSSHPFGIVQYIDELNGIVFLDSSNGRFSNSVNTQLRFFSVPVVGNPAYISNTYLVANATLSTVDNPIYHGLVPKFSFLEPTGTFLEVSYKGTANSEGSFLKDSGPTKLKNEQLYEYDDYERVLRSYSNEVAAASYGTSGTATYTVTLKTNSPYVSPVIDLGVKSFNYIQNLINNDDTNENTKYGNAKNKYISKNVTLNQRAEDLIVYVTGYRPIGTDIKAYAKLLNNGDNGLFDTKQWSELTLVPATQATQFSSPKDKEDYRELVFGFSSGNSVASQTIAYLDPNTTVPDVVVYYDSGGARYEGFDVFAIKLVLLSDNPVKIPTMRDVRAIALQK